MILHVVKISCIPCRLRAYRLFYKKAKFQWRGPKLRTILKATFPHQVLRLDANDMYYMTDDELEPKLTIFCRVFQFLLLGISSCSCKRYIYIQYLNKFQSTQDKECGQHCLFDLALCNSATEFKAAYERLYPDALVWDSCLP